MKQKILSVIIAFCLYSAFAMVQSQGNGLVISGKLSVDNAADVPGGASVKVKGTSNGTTADPAGVFRLTVASFPVTLLITHISYEDYEITVNKNTDLSIVLTPKSIIHDGVVMVSKGISASIINHTASAELLTSKRIQQLPTTSIYDGVVYLKGVDQNTSSLTMKTPSTRGFNGSGSSRVNQLVDGMDNQAPGLNFFVGNFNGPTELDIESIELLPGASSALYGPGGMNGTILINSKSPFTHQGLSVLLKQGVMNVDKRQRNVSAYNDYSLRWANAFSKRFAARIGVQYLSANDWLAGDSSNYLREGTSGRLIPGTRQTDPSYDGVNVYGDETYRNLRNIAVSPQQNIDLWYMVGQNIKQQAPAIAQGIDAAIALSPSVLNVSRTGYHEKEVIDPETKNIKLNGALHYKLNDKTEAILMGNWSTGNTIYTDDNRYVLKGIKIAQYKAELRHKKWFLRSYSTQEDAGEAYSATIAMQYLNEVWKPSGQWFQHYAQGYLVPAATLWMQTYGAALQNGQSQAEATTAANNALQSNVTGFHNMGRFAADQGRPVPGFAEFKQIFDAVRKVPIPNGALFKEKSQLWMHEGQYMFGDAAKNAEVIIGGNYKKYVLDSDGTLFIDVDKPINVYELGVYTQVTRKLFDEKLTLVASGRFDKNENFKGQFTPRVATLVKLAKEQNLRFSYQTAYRFPGNLAQWIRLNLGNIELLGGLPWVLDYMNVKEHPVIDLSTNAPLVYKEFKPETMRSFEVGYRGKFNKKMMIDVYAYAGSYKDFIGRIGLYQPVTAKAYSIVVNSSNKVKTYGFGLGLDYQLPARYSLFFNAYSDVITDVPSGFKAYFNAPKYKLNAGFANSGLGKANRVGFNVMMRWQDAFDYEGELANGPVKAFTTVDAQVSYKFPKIKSQVRLGGTNIFNTYYKNAYAHPEVGGLYYVSFAYNIF